MLSELCVRRPVFATMLVMSLVVLGIFSFRDLGVDLFPKADPATVNVVAVAARREPGRDVHVGRRADGGGDQRRLGHRRDLGAHRRGQRRSITVRFVLERDLNDAANDVREKVASAIRNVPPAAAAAGHHQGRSRRRSGDVAHRVVRRDEPADAHRARRQADRARHPDGQRRRPGQPRRRPRPRDPHRRRHREAELVRAVDDAGARRGRRRERRDSRRHGRAGQGPAAAAHARAASTRPRTSTTSSSRPGTARRFACPTSATPRTASSGRRAPVWLGETPAVHARHPPRDGREHGRGHRGRARASCRRSSGRCRKSVKMTVIRDDSRFIYASIASLEEHLIFGSLFAAIVVMFFIRNLRAVHHLGAGDSGVDHRVVHADAHHGVHAEQHDAARHHARRRHRHRRCDRRAREHLPLHRGEELLRRSRRRSRARARSRWP